MKNEILQNTDIPQKHSADQVFYSRGEELANIITSIVGCALGLIGGTLLIVMAAVYSLGALAVVSVSLYTFSLVAVYLFSTLYHSQPLNTMRRVVFRRFDHCSIPICIAGTYAPLMLIGLGNALGIVTASIILGLAVVVISLNAISIERFKHFSIIMYVIMGWIAVFVIVPMFKAGLLYTNILLLAGGAVFTTGILFYRNKKLRFNHAIWHFFFMGGHLLHYLCILVLLLTVR